MHWQSSIEVRMGQNRSSSDSPQTIYSYDEERPRDKVYHCDYFVSRSFLEGIICLMRGEEEDLTNYTYFNEGCTSKSEPPTQI